LGKTQRVGSASAVLCCAALTRSFIEVTQTTQTKQSKTWVVAVAAVVAAIGVAAWLLGRPSEPADQAVAEIPSEPAAAAPKATEPGPSLQAKPAPTSAAAPVAKQELPPTAAGDDVDLFADAMPDFMVDIHARVLDKKWLGVEDQKLLYNFGQEHKDDARPQLLLAWDSRNRDWDGMAISMYRIAFKADPRAAQDFNNLRDVLTLASKHEPGRVEFTEATEVVKKTYGLNALPMLDEELQKLNESGELMRAARLSKMRDELRTN
jgi:hypothetical protein